MGKKTACLVLSYCLYKDGTRLSVMAEKSAELGIEVICAREASHIIFSTAYRCWEKEAELKKIMAFERGIMPDKIKVIEGVRHTFDEVKGLKNALNSTGAGKLIVIVEKYHIPRVKRMFKKKFPEIELDFRIFQTKYERTFEPCKGFIIRWIKCHRGSHFTWWLWNFLCNRVW